LKGLIDALYKSTRLDDRPDSIGHESEAESPRAVAPRAALHITGRLDFYYLIWGRLRFTVAEKMLSFGGYLSIVNAERDEGCQTNEDRALSLCNSAC
jgi:hypothetical protein